jgi:hypothetical protein
MADHTHRRDGVSLAKGPAGLIGLASLALGVLGFIFGDQSFSSNPVDGNVNGDTFLGIEGNGWTWLLFAAGGLLLLLAAPMHWGAKTMSIIVGLAFGAASVISMVDGSDVFGIFATNGWTQLALGAAATALLLTALLPRVGRKREHHADREREIVRERPVATERDRERIVAPRREHRVIEREEPVVDRTGRFERDDVRDRDRTVVAPADGDGVRDHGRNDRF